MPSHAHNPRSLAESRMPLGVAQRRKTVLRSRDLATFDGLLEQLTDDQLLPFVDQLAAPLARYDALHGARLVETLRVFLAAGGSTMAAARALFLHPDSLRHRLARIEEITGRNPFAFEDRIAFAVAMRGWDERLRQERLPRSGDH